MYVKVIRSTKDLEDVPNGTQVQIGENDRRERHLCRTGEIVMIIDDSGGMTVEDPIDQTIFAICSDHN